MVHSCFFQLTQHLANDLHDPIAQVFAGEDIDLDVFEATAGPDKYQWVKNVAEDPCAAAEFFHFSVQAMLEYLFQVCTLNQRGS